MGEIRIVGPGKTRGYPYPVCKKRRATAVISFKTLDQELQLDHPHNVVSTRQYPVI